jgi:Chalcone isomerase-like
MNSFKKFFLKLLVALVAIGCVHATAVANQAEAARPAEVANSIANVRSVGSSRLKVWGFDIYDIRLWAAPKFKAQDYMQHDFAIEINYLRNFDNDAIAERSIKEMAAIGPMTPSQSSQWLAQMRKIFPDIAKGDRLVGIHKPNTGAQFTFNGKPAGEILDPEFGRLFFGIWISEQSSIPKMRRELLGLVDTAKP